MDINQSVETTLYQNAVHASEKKAYRESARYCWQLLKLTPYHPGVLNLLAINLHLLKKFKTAALIYRIANVHAPNNIMLLNNQGAILKNQGDIKGAIAAYEAAIAVEPKEFSAGFSLANLYQEQNEWVLALRCYEKILGIEPHHRQGLIATASLLHKLKQYRIAMNAYQKVLHLAPKDKEALLGFAICLQSQGLHRESIGYYQSLIQLDPDSPNYQINLGVAYKQIGDYEMAISIYQTVLKKQPELAYVYTNLGNAYCAAERFEEAITAYQAALDKMPRSAEAQNGLGYAYYVLNNIKQAAYHFQEALLSDPGHVEAHFNQAVLHLLQGDYAQGWPEYEWRIKKPEFHAILESITCPRWQGESLKGKTLVVVCEQGFGDTLQFIRFLSLIQKSDTQLILLTLDPLVSLLRQNPAIDRCVLSFADIQAPVDFYIPLLSLPYLFQLSEPLLFAKMVPYLYADQELNTQAWPELTEALNDKKLKVGISWHGSVTNKKIRHRACTLADFEPLFELQNIRFFSLQKYHGSDTVSNSQACVDLSPMMVDFSMTAAILERLDLIITIDTALAHLAGAMGKPVWTLLCARPDWRWMRNRSTSPWYPSMRLYRQTVLDDWSTPFSQIKYDLTALKKE